MTVSDFRKKEGWFAFPSAPDWSDVGMSLREWFAGLAMQAILSNPTILAANPIERYDKKACDSIAKAAFGVADAMLRETGYEGKPMTVKQLIEHLKQFKPDLPVIFTFHSDFQLVLDSDITLLPAKEKIVVKHNGRFIMNHRNLRRQIPKDQPIVFVDAVHFAGN